MENEHKNNSIDELVNELSVEEIKEQLALYQRLYYRKMKQIDPEYLQKKSTKEKERLRRKKAEQPPKEPSPNLNNRKYHGTEFMLIKSRAEASREPREASAEASR